MKKIVFIFMALFFVSIYSRGQNENPYSQFGYIGKVLKTNEEETGKQFLFLNTNDTAQILKSIVFNTKTHQVEYINHNDIVYKTDSLLSTVVLRFVSPDPHASVSFPKNSTI